MKRLLSIILLAGTLFAADVKLKWDPSPDADVGYRIHYGTASGSYTNVVQAGTNLTATVSGLAPGRTYFFAAKAYMLSNTNSVSDFSNEVNAPLRPGKPGNLTVEVTVTVTVTQP